MWQSVGGSSQRRSSDFNGTMRAVVSCEACGFRQEVARDIPRPTTFHLICHHCEQSLRVTVTAADIRTAEAMVRPRTPIS